LERGASPLFHALLALVDVGTWRAFCQRITPWRVAYLNLKCA
jgi:hypothetical protein